MYLSNEELLIKGRADINLPQFPDNKTYQKYGHSIFSALSAWTQNVLSVNQVNGGSNPYHPHHAPEQLILPPTSSLPLLIIRSARSKWQVRSNYEPNNNYREAGYLIPKHMVSQSTEISITTAPPMLATGFSELFVSNSTSSGNQSTVSWAIGDETSYTDNSPYRIRSDYSPARDRKIRPLVEAILEQLDYNENAFSQSHAITVGDYNQQVCKQFDPVFDYA